MSDLISVVVAFFAALGIISLVWIVFTSLSAPEPGSELFLLSLSRSLPDIEADLRHAAWLCRTSGAAVTLLLPEEALPEAEQRIALQISRYEHLTLAGHDFFTGNEYERNT